MPHFGDLIVFLKEAESLIERKEAERLKSREREIGNIVSGFNAKWQPALDTISEENTVDTVLGNPDTTAYINTISCNITAVRVSGYSCLDCIQRHSVITHQDWKVAAEQILSSQN